MAREDHAAHGVLMELVVMGPLWFHPDSDFF